MIKGFVFYDNKKIPFVIDHCHMELFSDDDVLADFTKNYNFRNNYTLQGLYFRDGAQGEKAEFLVDHSFGSTCYLKCFILYNFFADEGFDSIGFQSPFLDGVFRYEYEFLDLARSGKNLTIEPVELYRIPFSMESVRYELVYRIGHDNRLGLLEDYNRRGELILTLSKKQIQECYNIAVVLHRLAMFMTSYAEVPFKRIVLFKGDNRVGWLYCPFISEDEISASVTFFGTRFMDFDVNKYIPRIIENIAKDSGRIITDSVPMGHLPRGDSRYTPQRFMEQVMAFEYLFNKLYPTLAQDRKYPLKKELKQMFDEFPALLADSRLSSVEVSDEISKTRNNIAHGHAYYYEFENGSKLQFIMILLDRLIQKMSLQWMRFDKTEISEYPIY